MTTITAAQAALGGIVTGLDLRDDLDKGSIAEFRQALLAHEPLFFPEQGLTPEEQVRFGRSFGRLQAHEALKGHESSPEVVVMDTHGGATTVQWWRPADRPTGVDLALRRSRYPQ